MEATEYQTLFELEASYWWFRGLRAVLADTYCRLGLGPSARILDAGCGTGKNVEVLGHEVTDRAYGFDISPVAARYWRLRGLRHVCLASVNAIPFRDESFDAALGVDVLECDGVSEDVAYGELWRVLRTGGYLIVVVPAYRWLRSSEHHRAVHATRRYTRRRLADVLRRKPRRVVRMTHLFAGLLVPLALYRAWRSLRRGGEGRPPRSELWALPGWINDLLFRIVAGERRILATADLPIGSSILAVVQKIRA